MILCRQDHHIARTNQDALRLGADVNFWIYFSKLLPFIRMNLLIHLLLKRITHGLFCTLCHLGLFGNQLCAGVHVIALTIVMICFWILVTQHTDALSCAIQRNLDPHTARKVHLLGPFDLFHAISALDWHDSHQDFLIITVHSIHLAAVAALLRHPPQAHTKPAVFYPQKSNIPLFFSIIHIVNIKKLHTKSPPFIMAILMYVQVWDFMRRALIF